MDKIEFQFNIPAEYLHSGRNDEYIMIRAKRVFDLNLIEIVEMQVHLLGAISEPILVLAHIQKLAKEKFEEIDSKERGRLENIALGNSTII